MVNRADRVFEVIIVTDNLNLSQTGFGRVFEGNRDYFVKVNGVLMGRNKTLPGVNLGTEE